MKTLMHAMRAPIFVGLLIIPTLAGCQTRTQRSVVHHHSTQPYVVREVTTTTTKKSVPVDPAPVAQPAVVTESSAFSTPEPVKLTPAANDVVKLYESMVSEDVLISFAEHSHYPFKLTADQIVYMQDIGVSDAVLNAMIERDALLTGQPAPQMLVQNDDVAQEMQVAAAASEVQAPVYAGNPPPATEPVPQTTVTETRVVTREYFHDQLAPYGSWVHVNNYGWCWRPTVAVTNMHWQPYSDNGRWVYTDNGWYWHSYYSWGWAPFHYGRWSRHGNYGWVWVPDTVWGPSWVTWRYSDAYCGWAPLPPAAVYRSGFGFTYHGKNVSVGFGFGLTYDHFHFVSRRNFTHHHVGHHRLGRDQARSIYNRTTIVNNYNITNNNVVVNNGISPERIATGTSQEIKRVPLQDVDSVEGVKLASGDARQPRSLPVYRPKLPEQSRDVPQRILSKQQSRPALTRPNRGSENIALARSEESASRLQTSSANTQRPGTSRSTRTSGNRSGEANLKRPSASNSSSAQVRSSSRPGRTTESSSLSARPSTSNQSRSVTGSASAARPSTTNSSRSVSSNSNRNEPRRPTYAQPSASTRSNTRSRDSISYTPRPRTSSSSVSSSPRTVSPNTINRPDIQSQTSSNIRSRTPESSVTTSRPSMNTRSRQMPSTTSRPTYSVPSTRNMAPRSTPQVRSRSIPAPRSTPSRSVTRPAPPTRSSSGSVSQSPSSTPSRSVPSFRSSAPATRSQSSSSSSGSSSSSSSGSSRPSRPGR